jgi:hypothetical protein
MQAYYSHQSYLTQILDSFDYNKSVSCLEFGVGEGSSSVFYSYAKQHNTLQIDAYESDSNWLKETRQKYQLDNYCFMNVDNWNEFDFNILKYKKYDLIFIDQAPWEARILTLDSLSASSKNIILHDYNYYTKFFGRDFFEKYKISLMLEKKDELDPPTLIFKNELLLQK